MKVEYVVGTDIGGTFTDIVLVGGGSLYRKKLLSTPGDYSCGIVAGIKGVLSENGIDGSHISCVMHGTTVATNAILENKGTKTGLIITKGFRDILEIRMTRAKRDRLRGYVTDLIVPKPLVPRYLRMEVNERISHKGEPVRQLNTTEVAEVVQKLVDQGVEGIAICLLNSFENPVHEQIIGQFVRDNFKDIYLSLSYEVSPQLREYDRASTAVINSYVGPTVKHYLVSLVNGLKSIGIDAPLWILGSSGGTMGVDIATAKPMHIIESGPSAGVIASQYLAKKNDFDSVITLDMGGTTTKASMIENGEISRVHKYSVGSGINISSGELGGEGYPLSAPTIDIAEIGAGGGSIIWIDKGGLMKVGPRSSGAVPGPACYNQGGIYPTLTDANVTLGYLSPMSLAGGELQLDSTRAYHVIEKNLAEPLGLSVAEAAYGSYLIAVSNMCRAVKAISTERGRDPREYVLFAFGGSGPAFAAELARSLAIERVIIPPFAGIFSSLGLVVADVEHSLARSYITPLDKIDENGIEQAFRQLEGDILRMFALEKREERTVVLQRQADVGYIGQASTVTIPVVSGTMGKSIIPTLEDAFNMEYEKTYSIQPSNRPLELTNLRVIGISRRRVAVDPFEIDAMQMENKLKSVEAYREAYFGEEHGYIKVPVLARTDLSMHPKNGSFIIEEYDSTTVVPPNSRAYLDKKGSINIDIISEAHR